ncbi:MAG: TetR/AcrR family transcriptional regulator [Phenylobacterium sp.]|uniref:TetR/AcrR family transcriptional regulator n=1 Tax=Phenylobacterium sp. TaxID=1871053 RepID=UPI001A4DF81E|nr:TetR/AcrR family transcriptional regulator [Phenylobacterium sp.]MBL8556770.1 TetR/AcrR family transcriptional regulator [Phenylobacterium sp.]
MEPRIEDIDGVIPANQARSREAQARLIKAGEQVFAKKGYDEAHVTDIAAAAGCSIGSFYRRFRDKEALFRALALQFGERTHENFDRFFAMPQWREAPSAEVIHVLVENTARRIQRHPGFFRALFQRTLAGAGQLYRPALLAADEYSGRKLADFLRARDEGGENVEEACIMGLRTVQAALIHRVLHEQNPAYSVPTFAVDSLAQMLTLYLGVTPPRR